LYAQPSVSCDYKRYDVADPTYNEHCAPSILITFINMVLFKKADVTVAPCKPTMFEGQDYLQPVLVLMAAVCVPWMLFIKPFILKNQNEKKIALEGPHVKTDHVHADLESGQGTETSTPQDETQAVPRPAPAASQGGGGGHGHGEEFDFSEIFIHQAIHTIEYVLGSVSHTASYLRLWALSLAHARKFLYTDFGGCCLLT